MLGGKRGIFRGEKLEFVEGDGVSNRPWYEDRKTNDTAEQGELEPADKLTVAEEADCENEPRNNQEQWRFRPEQRRCTDRDAKQPGPVSRRFVPTGLEASCRPKKFGRGFREADEQIEGDRAEESRRGFGEDDGGVVCGERTQDREPEGDFESALGGN